MNIVCSIISNSVFEQWIAGLPSNTTHLIFVVAFKIAYEWRYFRIKLQTIFSVLFFKGFFLSLWSCIYMYLSDTNLVSSAASIYMQSNQIPIRGSSVVPFSISTGTKILSDFVYNSAHDVKSFFLSYFSYHGSNHMLITEGALTTSAVKSAPITLSTWDRSSSRRTSALDYTFSKFRRTTCSIIYT